MNTMATLQRFALVLSFFFGSVNSFGGILHHLALHHPAAAHPVVSQQIFHAAAAQVNPLEHLFAQYKLSLAQNPLPTKMVTGAVLATCGDALAQSQNKETEYSKRRAASFAVFDAAYRALQHYTFPLIVATCHGQFLSHLLQQNADPTILTSFAAMEQTLASQLGVVPFLYYPVFFSLTGLVQQLSVEATLQRAKENFLPLMQRNLLFWIPVQFVQFRFVPEELQIPFLSVCGLAWTCILSLAAGSTAQYNNKSDNTKNQAIEVMEEILEVTDEDLQYLTTVIVEEQLALNPLAVVETS